MSFGGRLEAYFTVPSASSILASDAGGGPTSVSLTAGSYTPTSFVAHVVARLNAVMASAVWSGSLSVGTSGTGLVTLTRSGTWSITFSTAAAGTVMGFVGDLTGVSGSQVGTQNARGLWLPDCPLNLDGDPASTPEHSDARSSESPTGAVITLVGCFKYAHSNLRWSHVRQSKALAGSESPTYSSWQSWIRDTQHGRGHTWFTPGSGFQVYYSSAGSEVIVGADRNGGAGPLGGWFASPPISKIDPKRVDAGWLGMWEVAIPRVVSSG